LKYDFDIIYFGATKEKVTIVTLADMGIKKINLEGK